MLVELAIQNFAIIDAVRVQFSPGFNVITGETGAGKSILIDALGAVLGDRTSSDMVRAGARSATIDATFDLEQITNRQALNERIHALEIETDEGLLILSREIQRSGRSSARINGRPTTASILSEIGALIVDVHGQSDHLSLLSAASQLDLLDRYAGAMSLREQFARAFRAWRSARIALGEARTGARERMQRVDLLRYQIDEIRRANPRQREDDELGIERGRLANADRLMRDAANAYATLSGGEEREDQGAMPSLRQAAALVGDLASIDQAADGMAERLKELLFLLEGFLTELRDYRDAVEADPDRLEAVEERLSDLRQLKRKYGTDIADVLAHAAAAEDELARLTGTEVDAETLAARVEALGREAGDLAEALSRQRQSAATCLASEAERAIEQLQMGSAKFAIMLERHEDARGVPIAGESGSTFFGVDATGVDRVTYVIAPNSGEGFKPLGRIASGGETARLMLALKSILSEVDQTPTLVFDEIDVGVGGRSGQVVGEKLWALASRHQVIVITHLPQIAAFADAHFQITKSQVGGRVVSGLELLEDDARLLELAAMLDGLPVRQSALQGAADMLARAQVLKSRAGAAA